MTFSSMKVIFGNKKNANKAKLYCSEYGFHQSGSFRSEYEWNQFKTKNDFANAIERYLNNPNTYIERLEIDNGVAAGFRDNELVLLKMLVDDLKG
jgi:hypothetical protein